MKKVIKKIKDVLMAIIMGELLYKMNLDRYFIHIAYTFFLFWMIILSSMMVQNAMVRAEKRKIVLENAKIYNAQKTVQLVSLGRLKTVEDLLEKQGSDLALPGKPADRIK